MPKQKSDITPKPVDFYKVVKEYQDYTFNIWRRNIDEQMMAKLEGRPVNFQHSKHSGVSWPEYAKHVFGDK